TGRGAPSYPALRAPFAHQRNFSGAPWRAFNVLMPVRRDGRADGLEQDLEVHPQAHVLDVEEVVLQLLPDVLEVGVVAPLPLREAGDAGLDAVAAAVERDGLDVLLDEVGPLGAGPDEAHVAAEDVPELGDLVEAEAAQEAADGGHAV